MSIRDGPAPYAKTVPEAAVLGLHAGLDQEGGGNGCVQTLPDLVQNGTVNASAVARAFRRLFRVRMRLGMLDPPLELSYNHIQRTVAASEPHLQVALRAARESICMYKNEPVQLIVDKMTATTATPVRPAANVAPVAALPLSAPKDKPWKLLLAGAQGNSSAALIGNYAESASVGEWGSSVLSELRAALASPTSGGKNQSSRHSVTYMPGCDAVECNNTRAFPMATAAAAEADAIVVLLGLHYSAAGNATQCDHDKPWITDAACEGEGTDRINIELPGNQTELVAALREAARPGVPLVGVLIHGGALALGTVADDLDAVLDAWYPGMMGARAIADVLFGRYNPAGRTAVTWYNSTSVLPQTIAQTDFYAGDGLTYRYFKRPEAILYPFGHGKT